MKTKLTNHFNIITLFIGFWVMLLSFPSLSYGESLETENVALSISGTVTDSKDGLPVIGASVIVKGTSTGATTNVDGKYKVEAVTFTGSSKEEMAYPLRAAFEDKNIRIPEDKNIRADLRSIKKETTASGNIRFTADRGKNGHADRFWAVALAVEAGGKNVALMMPKAASRGTRHGGARASRRNRRVF